MCDQLFFKLVQRYIGTTRIKEFFQSVRIDVAEMIQVAVILQLLAIVTGQGKKNLSTDNIKCM